MLRIINSTPFDTSITLHGRIRLLHSPKEINTTIANPPPYREYFTEWVKILKDGPLNKQINFCLDPWTSYESILKSSETINLTMGFNDVHTQWTKHTPGIFEWDGKFNEVTVFCQPGTTQVQRRGRGPLVYGDIPLRIKTKSENPSWKVVQTPITTVQYSPTFDVSYYKNQR